MIIFCFLGVSPPCCSILCQFWLCEEAQCVYLHRDLGSPMKLEAFNTGNWTLLSVYSQGMNSLEAIGIMTLQVLPQNRLPDLRLPSASFSYGSLISFCVGERT